MKYTISDLINIETIEGVYYEQLYANRLDNVVTMGKFLGRKKLPKLNKKGTEYMNRPIANKEIELIIKDFPQIKTRLYWFILPNILRRVRTGQCKKKTSQRRKLCKNIYE